MSAYERGMALLRAGRDREAVAAFRAAAGTPAPHADHHLALALRLCGQLDEARRGFLDVLVRAPDFTPACTQLGALDLLAGDTSAALDWFRRALALDPDYQVARYQLGVTLLLLGRREEGVTHLQACLEPGPRALPPLVASRARGQLLEARHGGVAVPVTACSVPVLTEIVELDPLPIAPPPPPRRAVGTVEVSVVDAASQLGEARRILALTGSGISVGSGLATRKELWKRWDRDAAVSLLGFRRDPAVLWRVVAEFLGDAEHPPSPAHLALARLPNLVGVVTQNVDGLHQEAHRATHGEATPMPPVIEMHGTLLETRCDHCDHRPGRPASHYAQTGLGVPVCPACGGPVRPDVVLFGERVKPERMRQALDLLASADALLVIGTAMDVAPSSELPRLARAAGLPVVEVKRARSRLARSLDTLLVPGEADDVLPALVAALSVPRA